MNPISQRLIICRAIREARATSLEDVHACRNPKSTCIIYPRLPSHDNFITEPFQIPLHLNLRPSTLPRHQAGTLLHRKPLQPQVLTALKCLLQILSIISSRGEKGLRQQIPNPHHSSIQTINPRGYESKRSQLYSSLGRILTDPTHNNLTLPSSQSSPAFPSTIPLSSPRLRKHTPKSNFAAEIIMKTTQEGNKRLDI